MKRKYRLNKKVFVQRLIGIAILGICAVVMLMASKGLTTEDKDISAVVLFAPLGLYLLFSKNIVIDF